MADIPPPSVYGQVDRDRKCSHSVGNVSLAADVNQVDKGMTTGHSALPGVCGQGIKVNHQLGRQRGHCGHSTDLNLYRAIYTIEATLENVFSFTQQ